jgi:hypothetical protein
MLHGIGYFRALSAEGMKHLAACSNLNVSGFVGANGRRGRDDSNA